jgi:predicted amidophosphoribosyltransferase
LTGEHGEPQSPRGGDLAAERLPGRWRYGFALDYHTVSSTYLGDDEYGHPLFDTQRSDLGELLYRLKYRSDASAIDEIVTVAAGFYRSWNPGATLIVPVPPSRSGRPQQPVSMLATALGAQLSIAVGQDAVTRNREIPEIKNVYAYDDRLRALEGTHTIAVAAVRGQRVLLLDDLYRSGATMNAITAALYDQGGVADVYALAITRTRSRS